MTHLTVMRLGETNDTQLYAMLVEGILSGTAERSGRRERGDGTNEDKAASILWSWVDNGSDLPFIRLPL